MEHNIHDRRAPHGPRFANIDAGGDGKISLQAGCIDRSPRAFWPSLDATRVVSCRFRLHAFGSRFTLPCQYMKFCVDRNMPEPVFKGWNFFISLDKTSISLHTTWATWN